MKELIEELGIKIIEEKIKGKGYYLPDINCIVVNSDLKDEIKKEVILHELGHAAKTRNLDKKVIHSVGQAEEQANAFMIEETVKEYLTETEPEDFSTVRFLEQFGLPTSFEWLTEKIVSEKGLLRRWDWTRVHISGGKITTYFVCI